MFFQTLNFDFGILDLVSKVILVSEVISVSKVILVSEVISVSEVILVSEVNSVSVF